MDEDNSRGRGGHLPRKPDVRNRDEKSGGAGTLLFAVTASFLFIGATENLVLLLNRGPGFDGLRDIALLAVFGTGLSLLGALGVLACAAAVLAPVKAGKLNFWEKAAAWSDGSPVRVALLLTIPFLPIYLYMCPAIFEGAGIQEKLAVLTSAWDLPFSLRPLFSLAAYLAMAGGTWLLLLAFAAGTGLGSKKERNVLSSLPGPAVILLACLGATWINCTFALRLYDKLHASLSALVILASAISFGAIYHATFTRGRRPKHARGAASCLAILGCAVIVFLFARFHTSHNVARLIAEWNPTQSIIIKRTQGLLRFIHAEKVVTLLPTAEAPPPFDVAGAEELAEPVVLHHLLPESHRWNVLFILVDSLRPDRIGALGDGAASTPTIDEMAARGVVFLKCYSQGVFTGSSLPAIFTSAPIPFLLHRDPENDFATLVDMVRGEGYRTFSLYPFYSPGSVQRVKHHSAQGAIMKAFQTTSFEKGSRAQDKSLDGYLRECAGKREEPFFIYWHLAGPRTLFDTYLTASKEEALRSYDRQVGAEDERIGRILLLLNELSLSKSTIIILTADHGEEMLDHGATFHGTTVYNEQTHVPLIFVIPGAEPRVSGQPVASIDIMPTLLDLLNVGTETPLYGRSLVPYIQGERPGERPVFSFAGNHYWAVVEGDWKLIWDRVLGFVELYNLAEDPLEQRNLAQTHPGRAAAMKKRFLRLLAHQRQLSAPGNGRRP